MNAIGWIFGSLALLCFVLSLIPRFKHWSGKLLLAGWVLFAVSLLGYVDL